MKLIYSLTILCLSNYQSYPSELIYCYYFNYYLYYSNIILRFEMGNSQSSNISTGDKINAAQWEQVSKVGQVRVLGNRNDPRYQIQEHHVSISDTNQLKKAEQVYKMRKNDPELVSTQFFQVKEQKQLCTKSFQGKAYTQRIPLRLSDIIDIPFPDILHVYNQAFNGYHRLARTAGSFKINQQSIGINNQNIVKVWHSPNFSQINPTHRLDSQQSMVNNIVKIIQSNTDHNTMPHQQPVFSQFLYKQSSNVGFSEAKRRLEQYANAFNRGVIPNYCNCISRAGGADIIQNNYLQSKKSHLRTGQHQHQNSHSSNINPQINGVHINSEYREGYTGNMPYVGSSIHHPVNNYASTYQTSHNSRYPGEREDYVRQSVRSEQSRNINTRNSAPNYPYQQNRQGSYGSYHANQPQLTATTYPGGYGNGSRTAFTFGTGTQVQHSHQNNDRIIDNRSYTNNANYNSSSHAPLGRMHNSVPQQQYQPPRQTSFVNLANHRQKTPHLISNSPGNYPIAPVFNKPGSVPVNMPPTSPQFSARNHQILANNGGQARSQNYFRDQNHNVNRTGQIQNKPFQSLNRRQNIPQPVGQSLLHQTKVQSSTQHPVQIGERNFQQNTQAVQPERIIRSVPVSDQKNIQTRQVDQRSQGQFIQGGQIVLGGRAIQGGQNIQERQTVQGNQGSQNIQRGQMIQGSQNIQGGQSIQGQAPQGGQIILGGRAIQGGPNIQGRQTVQGVQVAQRGQAIQGKVIEGQNIQGQVTQGQTIQGAQFTQGSVGSGKISSTGNIVQKGQVTSSQQIGQRSIPVFIQGQTQNAEQPVHNQQNTNVNIVNSNNQGSPNTFKQFPSPSSKATTMPIRTKSQLRDERSSNQIISGSIPSIPEQPRNIQSGYRIVNDITQMPQKTGVPSFLANQTNQRPAPQLTYNQADQVQIGSSSFNTIQGSNKSIDAMNIHNRKNYESVETIQHPTYKPTETSDIKLYGRQDNSVNYHTNNIYNLGNASSSQGIESLDYSNTDFSKKNKYQVASQQTSSAFLDELKTAKTSSNIIKNDSSSNLEDYSNKFSNNYSSSNNKYGTDNYETTGKQYNNAYSFGKNKDLDEDIGKNVMNYGFKMSNQDEYQVKKDDYTTNSGKYQVGNYNSGQFRSTGKFQSSGKFESGQQYSSGSFDSGKQYQSRKYDSGNYDAGKYVESGKYDSANYDSSKYDSSKYDSGNHGSGNKGITSSYYHEQSSSNQNGYAPTYDKYTSSDYKQYSGDKVNYGYKDTQQEDANSYSKKILQYGNELGTNQGGSQKSSFKSSLHETKYAAEEEEEYNVEWDPEILADLQANLHN